MKKGNQNTERDILTLLDNLPESRSNALLLETELKKRFVEINYINNFLYQYVVQFIFLPICKKYSDLYDMKYENFELIFINKTTKKEIFIKYEIVFVQPPYNTTFLGQFSQKKNGRWQCFADFKREDDEAIKKQIESILNTEA